MYYLLSEELRVDDLLSWITELPRADRWQTLARMALRYDLYAALAALTAQVLATTSDTGQPQARVSQWESANCVAVAAAHRAIGEVDEGRSDLAQLSVLLRQIRTLGGR